MQKIKVSVVTPTVRPEGLKIVKDALSKQTLQDFEWLICSPFDPKIATARWIKDDFQGGFWSLNRAYNKLFKKMGTEVVVSWQDWIWMPPDGLQNLLEALQSVGDSVIGIVGDQYEKVGRFGKPEVKIWADPRKTNKYGDFYESFPSDNEWNLCILPKKLIYDVGGFCEELDFTGFGMDGYQVNERLDLLGYKFYLAQYIESFTVRHGRESYKGKDYWDKNNNLTNGQYEKVRKDFVAKGEWPRMNYLKN